MHQSPDAHLLETKLASLPLFEGPFISVQRDVVRLPDGGTATRDFVLHPGAAVVIALLDDGRVVVERQYRHPVGQVLIEFPAGKLNPGEDPWVCARRELLEETGYTASHMAYAGLVHLAPAYCDERLHVFFAKGLSKGQRQLDEGEFVEVVLADPQALLQSAAVGEMSNATALVCCFWLQRLLSHQLELTWQTV